MPIVPGLVLPFFFLFLFTVFLILQENLNNCTRLQCSPSQVDSSLAGFSINVFRRFSFSFRGSGKVFLKLRVSFPTNPPKPLVIFGNRRHCRLTNAYNQQNSAQCFALTLTKPRIPKYSQATRFVASPRFGNGSKKTQLISAAYKGREIHISINWRRSSPVSRMPRFSSTYVAHTHKLLTDHLQTSVAYQINVARYFNYFLLQEIPVASLYIIGYHKVVIVQRGWLILILRRPISRSRYLIRRLHQVRVLLALMLQELCLE